MQGRTGSRGQSVLVDPPRLLHGAHAASNLSYPNYACTLHFSALRGLSCLRGGSGTLSPGKGYACSAGRALAKRRLACRKPLTVAHARREGGGFWTGFALGGAICGAAGFFFAPQVRYNPCPGSTAVDRSTAVFLRCQHPQSLHKCPSSATAATLRPVRWLLQISRAILNEQQKFKIPTWFEDKPPVTKAELEEKIDELHAAISEVAGSIGGEEPGRSNANSSNGASNIDVMEKV